MPTVEFSTPELLGLVGKKMPLEDLEYKAAMLGTDPECVDAEKTVIEVFPNRPDMLSIEGFARALKSFIGVGGGYKGYKVASPATNMSLDESVNDVRPYISCAIVRGIKIDDDTLVSLMNMQELLHGSHGRKRSKVAIGVHDLDKTKPPYSYTTKAPQELRFIPLDFSKEMHLQDVLEKHPKGESYRHILEGKKRYPVVMDKEGVVSLPPIINADRTRVTADTKNLFIEITGTNTLAVGQAMNIIATALADRGGKIESVNVGKDRTPDLEPKMIALNLNYVKRLLGLELKTEQVMELAGKMGYGIKSQSEGSIEVLIPPYRADVLHPIDIIEDLAIAYGYENFVAKPTSVVSVGSEDGLESFSNDVRRLAIGLGFQETIGFVLTNEQQSSDAGLEPQRAVKIKNPRTTDYTLVRQSLLPGLLAALAYNKKKRIPQKLFELDDVVLSKKEHQNHKMLSLGILDQEVNFSQMQSVVEALMRNIGVDFKLREDKKAAFIPGRCAQVLIGREKVGVFGEVHPEVLEKAKLEYPVLAAELDIEGIMRAKESP